MSADESQIPPVEPGETRTVTIEDLGEQGDGIARVERDYVIIVSDATPDEEVRVKVEDVYLSYAFASVVSRGDTSPRRSFDDDEQSASLAGASSKYEVEVDER